MERNSSALVNKTPQKSVLLWVWKKKKPLKPQDTKSEDVGWLAIEPGSGAWGDSTYYAGQTGDSVTHRWSNVDFNSLFEETPQLMAGISSYDGADPSGLRYQNLDSNGVEIKVEEDTKLR